MKKKAPPTFAVPGAAASSFPATTVRSTRTAPTSVATSPTWSAARAASPPECGSSSIGLVIAPSFTTRSKRLRRKSTFRANNMRFLIFPILLAASAFGQTTPAIDNDQVRALVAHQQPHAKTPLHEHQFNRVMVYLQSGSEFFFYTNKAPAPMNFKAGEVQWSPAGGMHMAEITSPEPVTIVEIELKKPGAKLSATGPLDPVVVDPKHYKVEFENDQVRVLRVKIGPHESTPEHQHRSEER